MTPTTERTLSVPVELVCTSGPVPAILRGKLSHLHEGLYIVDVEQVPPGIRADQRAILNIIDGKAPRVLGTITRVEGRRITLSQQALRERERRVYPRLHAGIPLRFRVPAPDAAAAAAVAWLRSDEGSAEDPGWVTHESLVNFSVTGLGFDSPIAANNGDLVLLDMGMPGRPERWRCTGVLVRVSPVPPDELEEDDAGRLCAHRYALNFETIPHAAQAALTELTIQMQDAMI